MNPFIKTIRFSVFIAAISVLLLFHAPPSDADTPAAAVVDRYMQGLFSGDLETIQQCLAESFQERRKNTFKDPGYANFLIERYGGATYRIVNQTAQTNGTIVDVEIIYGSAERVVIRLMLDRRNQIVDEMRL